MNFSAENNIDLIVLIKHFHLIFVQKLYKFLVIIENYSLIQPILIHNEHYKYWLQDLLIVRKIEAQNKIQDSYFFLAFKIRKAPITMIEIPMNGDQLNECGGCLVNSKFPI